PEGRWLELQKAVADFRGTFQAYLLDRIGCFQGTGRAAYAIDIVRLANATAVDADNSLANLTNTAQRKHVTDLQPNRLKARVQPVIKNLLVLGENAHKNLGETVQLDRLLNALKGLISDFEGAGVWPGPVFDKQSLISEIDRFRGVLLRDVLEQIKQLS